jgi:aryl-alcohol dehydrogenase-like predicted oxidoreductase
MSPQQESPSRAIADVLVFPVGLGAMSLSDPHMIDQRDRAIATVHAALDAGVNLIDTADIYAPNGHHFGHNEVLVAEALRTWAGDKTQVMVVTKGGITRTPGPDGDMWGRSGDPAGLLAAAQASASRLGGDPIDLYLLHRADPRVPFNAQMVGLAAIRDAGVARRIGLSNVNPAQLDRALQLLGGPDDGGIVAVENEFSPRFRKDPEVLATCSEHGIAFLTWSPLGGMSQSKEIGSRYAPFAAIAAAHGVSVQQVAIAWLLGRSPVLIPIPGATRPATIRDSAAAATLSLTDRERAELDATVPEDVSVFPDDTPLPPM